MTKRRKRPRIAYYIGQRQLPWLSEDQYAVIDHTDSYIDSLRLEKPIKDFDGFFNRLM